MTDERTFPEDTLDALFTYHAPSADQQVRYQTLRDAARDFAYILVHACPESNDRTDAIRKLRECVMIANASIALEKVRA